MEYQISGHALTRYYTAHSIDPLTAAQRIRHELKDALPVTDFEEARRLAGGPVKFHPGHTYRAGGSGLFVCKGYAVLTYISAGLKHYRHKERYGKRRPSWIRA